MYRKITILGSTGSIGKQSLELCKEFNLEVVALACNDKWQQLLEQIEEFKPQAVAINNVSCKNDFENALAARIPDSALRPQVFYGKNASSALAEYPCDLVIAAIMGIAGLAPNLAFLNKGYDMALANKESLVCAPHLLRRARMNTEAVIIPIDSEHAAINECLKSGNRADLSKIWLTASGGPFFKYKQKDLENVSPESALAHPQWKMGAKITIDSATMMNKGLELIEACHLFDVGVEQIEILVHPQAIVHSAVEWADGQVTAQLSFPDMRTPIKAALFWPQKVTGLTEKFNFFDARANRLEFFTADLKKFPCLGLAKSAMINGAAFPLVMNAANEVAVAAFLAGEIKFTGIAKLIESALNHYAKDPIDLKQLDHYEAIEDLDREYRKFTRMCINA